MALPSTTVRREAKWIAYYLLEGVNAEDMLGMWERRFPDLPVSRFITAMTYARRMLRVGARVQALAPEAQLQQALGRGIPPDPRVSVSVLYHWTDAQGHDYWNTIKIGAQWTDTVADVLARAQAEVASIMDRYSGSTVQGWEIVPSVLWPSGEQL